MITLKQYNGSSVTPQDDAILYDHIIQDSGIISGCAVTHLGAGQLRVADGRGIVQGRCFVVEAETVQATLAQSGELSGRLIIRIDIANTDNPIQFISQAAATLPDLVQEDINGSGTVYELPLATYTAEVTQISGLTSVAHTVISHASRTDNPHGVTASQIGAAPSSHTHAPSDLTAAVPVSKGGTGAATAAAARAALGAMEDAIVPITKGGTGYNNPTQAAYALRKQVRVGTGSTSTTGYFPVATWDISGTYQTIQTILAVGANSTSGNNILSINLRASTVAGTIYTPETFMTWLSPSFEKTFYPENWFIDNSVAGTATLYVYLSGSYITRNVGVIFEAQSTDNSANGVTLISNYANVPVEGTNYVTSITKTVTAKIPITASKTDLTAGTSSLATGQLYLCYE